MSPQEILHIPVTMVTCKLMSQRLIQSVLCLQKNTELVFLLCQRQNAAKFDVTYACTMMQRLIFKTRKRILRAVNISRTHGVITFQAAPVLRYLNKLVSVFRCYQSLLQMNALKKMERKKDFRQSVVALHSSGSPYPLFQFDEKQTELEYKVSSKLELFGGPQTIPKKAIKILNTQVLDKLTATDVSTLNEFKVSRFLGNKTLQDTAISDLWNVIISTRFEENYAADLDSDKALHSFTSMLVTTQLETSGSMV